MLDSRLASSLSDNELLARIEQLRRREREITLEILRHLIEIESRKLHLKLGYASLFAYCTEHLRYSESAAGRRVQAARCMRQFPKVAALLERGELNLMTLGLVANLLTEKSAGDLLDRIRGKTQREVEAIASTFRPPIRLRDRVQRVNVPAPIAPALPVAELEVTAPSAPLVKSGTNSQTGSEKTPSASKTVTKLYIQFLADEAFMRRYNEACALLSNKIPRPSFEAVFGELMDEFIKRHSPKERQARREQRKTADPIRRPRKSQVRANDRRAISARTRDTVFLRDGGRCTFMGRKGRCGETRNLHIDHITPVARNGTNDPGNLRLLCGRHNQLEAERILGEGVMGRNRHAGAREPAGV